MTPATCHLPAGGGALRSLMAAGPRRVMRCVIDAGKADWHVREMNDRASCGTDGTLLAEHEHGQEAFQLEVIAGRYCAVDFTGGGQVGL